MEMSPGSLPRLKGSLSLKSSTMPTIMTTTPKKIRLFPISDILLLLLYDIIG
jgi:hypothetical protein